MELNEEHGYLPLRISKIRGADEYIGASVNGATFIGAKKDLQAAKIHTSVNTIGPVFLSGRVSIGKGSTIGSACWLLDAKIGCYSRLDESVRVDTAEIESYVFIGGNSLICESYLPEETCIGESCRVVFFDPKNWLRSAESAKHTSAQLSLGADMELQSVRRFITGTIGQHSDSVTGYSFFIGGGHLRVGCTGKSIRDWLGHSFELEPKRSALFALANWDELVEHYIAVNALQFGQRDMFRQLAQTRKKAVADYFNTFPAALGDIGKYKVDLSPLFGDSE